MVQRARLLIPAVALWAFPLHLRAAPTDGATAALERGENLYFEGKYEDALFVLEELARGTDLEPSTRARALKYVAFSYFLLGAPAQAREAWLRLLEVQPGYEPDPVEVSPELLEFFGAIEATPAVEAATGPPPGAAELQDPGPDAPQVHERARGCGIWLCLLPAGIGQFVNAYDPVTERYSPAQIVKGVIFAVLEPLFLSLNIAFWALNQADLRPDGTPVNPALSDQRYTLQMTFFGLTLGTVLLGVADAFLFY